MYTTFLTGVEAMIESHGVTIQTATITIQAVKINNRQMTQAVFNQLQICDGLIDPFDENGECVTPFEINGDVWGWVNFKPKEAWSIRSTHGQRLAARHFMVVRGDTLYRAEAPRDWMAKDGPFPVDDMDLIKELGMERYADAMNDVRKRLLKFPQLFIAV
jgi:hypothetical protein